MTYHYTYCLLHLLFLIQEASIDNDFQRYSQRIKVQKTRNCELLCPKRDIYITPLPSKSHGIHEKEDTKRL